jgi:hypothetical protein
MTKLPPQRTVPSTACRLQATTGTGSGVAPANTCTGYPWTCKTSSGNKWLCYSQYDYNMLQFYAKLKWLTRTT